MSNRHTKSFWSDKLDMFNASDLLSIDPKMGGVGLFLLVLLKIHHVVMEMYIVTVDKDKNGQQTLYDFNSFVFR
jgi:hypothetical protein